MKASHFSKKKSKKSKMEIFYFCQIWNKAKKKYWNRNRDEEKCNLPFTYWENKNWIRKISKYRDTSKFKKKVGKEGIERNIAVFSCCRYFGTLRP